MMKSQGLLVWFIATLLSSLGAVSALGTELLVPAYAHPCCGAGKEMWTQMADLATAGSVHLNVILNPNSGPGASPLDAVYLGTNGQLGPLPRLRRAGATIVGYVHTQYGERSWDEVRAEIDRYWDPEFWRGGEIQVDGLFVDEMSNDWARIPYYQRLRDYVRAKSSKAKIIGNPGTRFTNNSAGVGSPWTADDYLATVDTMVVFEESGDAYRAATRWPDWTQQGDARRFAHIVHTVATETSMREVLKLTHERHAGMVYVTDDVMPNPYDRLPSYWSTEASLVAIPEPTLGTGLWSIAWLAFARRPRSRHAIASA